MPEHFQRVNQKHKHNNHQPQRVDVRGYTKRSTIQEAEQTQRPYYSENGGQLHQVLLREMVSGIQFEDEHVVDSGRTPTVNVYTDEKYELDEKEWASVHAEGYF